MRASNRKSVKAKTQCWGGFRSGGVDGNRSRRREFNRSRGREDRSRGRNRSFGNFFGGCGCFRGQEGRSRGDEE